MALVLKKKDIDNFLKELKEEQNVVDARKEKGLLPIAKAHFFPPKEKIFKYRKGYIDSPVYQKKTVIFGLNPVDLEAVTFMDEIMEKPEPDFFYAQRREKTVLIGLSEYSLKNSPGGDLILEKINSKQYRVIKLTEKGRKISSKFFKEIKKPKIKKYSSKKTILEKLLLDSERLANAVAWSHNHEIWNELEKECLGCGNCTYVCPLCYCFSIEDQIDLDGKCTRCRQWDSCTLPDFARVAGDHDFHKGVKNRYYNWFYHKFVRGYKEYGRALCVGCHRCQESCPAGIDIEKILKRIVKDYEKSL
jgi:sulfhydrogenase subunit beta (sulfur reductase)